MAFQPPASARTIVVRCKRCQQIVPARVEDIPKDWMVVFCGFCTETRRYLPSETFIGRPSRDLGKMQA